MELKFEDRNLLKIVKTLSYEPLFPIVYHPRFISIDIKILLKLYLIYMARTQEALIIDITYYVFKILDDIFHQYIGKNFYFFSKESKHLMLKASNNTEFNNHTTTKTGTIWQAHLKAINSAQS